jgi:monoterpene epsilon-lactone hydrolase
MKVGVFVAAMILVASTSVGRAQQPDQQIPETDTSYVDAQGAAHVTRVVPIPKTVSPEARNYLMKPVYHPGPNATLEENRRQRMPCRSTMPRTTVRSIQ